MLKKIIAKNKYTTKCTVVREMNAVNNESLK